MEEQTFDFEADIDAKDALRKASIRAEGAAATDTSTTRGLHSIVCKHWLRRMCVKGDKCDFLHRYDPSRMPECVNFLKFGTCPDPMCVFRHVQASERPECQRYRLGFCRYGPMCRSRHDRLPPSAMPELLPDWFIDSLIFNSHLVPRCEDVRFDLPAALQRRAGFGGDGTDQELALATVGTEQGTIPGLPPPIHGKCRYFVVRSMSVRNIQVSAAKGIWATGTGNSQRLRQAFGNVDHVIIIFAASESRCFYGYGKMSCEPDSHLFPGIWGELSCRLGANFRVHWIKECVTQCSHADHIKNPHNNDLPVRRCKDGQELPSSVGECLCRFLWQQLHTDVLKGSDLEFEPRVNYDEPPFLPPLPAHADSGRSGASQVQSSSAPLAIEDVKQDSGNGSCNGVDNSADVANQSKPAPEKIGSFQVKARSMNSSTVTVGKALASGSSSLLAAMTEDAHRHIQPHGVAPGMPPMLSPMHPGCGGATPYGHPGLWLPPPPGWVGHQPPPEQHHHARPPHEWLPPRAPPPPQQGGYYPPMPSYQAPPNVQGYPSLEDARAFEQGRPPGFWRDRGPPPAEWEGASATTGHPPGHLRDGRNGQNGDGRSRSRSRKRHRKRKK
eukprot:TRINITY_DN29905_c0_g1_i1.p1 TRINITY_DN29905_c0_g1~~TRINITY_DN29905_c0_g1_i1.p1  ORF type:complete len:612 (+),score=94.89 TRINITY_DN29905_c0_g1_i1:111-1946(+)